MENKSLQHHGILGMKWGVRRYQTKDGKLTPAGKKRYNAEMEKLKQREAIVKNKQRTQSKINRLLEKSQELDDIESSLKNKTKKPPDEPKTTTKKAPSSQSMDRLPDVKSLSDSELNAIVARLKNEKQYKQYVSDAEKARKTRGQKFVDKIINDVVIPSALNASKNVLDDILADLAKKARKK